MIKQILIILTIGGIFYCVTLVAQEKPQNDEAIDKDTVKTVNDETTDMVEEIASETPWNKVCPVMGNPIEDDTPTVEYNGKTYGFCCPGCDGKFTNNPEKYSKNLNEEGTRYIGR